MNPRSLVIVVLVGAAAAFPGAGPAAATESPAALAASGQLEPVRRSASCDTDVRRRSACRLVHTFFRAVNTRHFGRACALLGRRLSSDTYGVSCAASLDGQVAAPVPWGILEARVNRAGINVLVEVGQLGLERIWMRTHRLYVAREEGRLRILETRLVG
jgi:hypothetical protein